MRQHLTASGLILGLVACAEQGEVLHDEGFGTEASSTAAWLAICDTPDFDTGDVLPDEDDDTGGAAGGPGDTGDTGDPGDTGDASDCPCWTATEVEAAIAEGFDDAYCFHASTLGNTQLDLRSTGGSWRRFAVEDEGWCERWRTDPWSWQRKPADADQREDCRDILREQAADAAVPNYDGYACY